MLIIFLVNYKNISYNRSMKKAELISLAFELGFQIAVPLVLFALLGRYTDKAWGTSPLFLLVGVVLATVIATFLVYKKINKLL